MTSVSPPPMMPLPISEKQIKCHAVQLMLWLWPKTEVDLWPEKLAFGKTLADVTLRLPVLELPDVPIIQNWAMCVAAMLNGPEQIFEDPNPFTIQHGKSPELQAWRMLVIHSLALLPDEGYLISNAARIALNTIELPIDEEPRRFRRTPADYGADVVHYLNFQGRGNSIAWFRELDVTKYEAALAEALKMALQAWQQSFGGFAELSPKTSVLGARLTRQQFGVQILINAAAKMLPRAVKEVSVLLQPLQSSIPASAEKQLGMRASTPYEIKTMVPNPGHVATLGRSQITDILRHYRASLASTASGTGESG